MNSNHLPSVTTLYRASMLFLIFGVCAIFLEYGIKLVFMIQHTIFDVVPSALWTSQLESWLYILIPAIGIPSVILLLICVPAYLKEPRLFLGVLATITIITTSLLINASLLIGGGWYVGTVTGDAGIIILLITIVIHEKAGIRLRKYILKGSLKRRMVKIQGAILAIVCVSGINSALWPMIAGTNVIPDSLILAGSANPASITPNHNNTFYILPIWEWEGNNYTYGTQQLNYMNSAVGSDAYTGHGFVRIGRSVSCWYTNDINASGDFDPTHLIEDLNLANMTNTPILFHMNGGNWGQASSTNQNISAMRENISNCQWDQYNNCTPIKYNPGPNDRYWSLAPNTDWEHYREHNIKQALTIIHAWWLLNPTLLVGFSTDSEIHENDNNFQATNPGHYKSYFDYNNASIAQYRSWARANWSLTQFNALCGTNFTAWANVDAPRSPSVVGVVGNPWWETWTDFRIWQVQQAVQRQCFWIHESGFPRDMILSHQILSEPGDPTARYQRCDPIQTSSNPYCNPGVTRYSWTSPQTWQSIGQLALNESTNDSIPSWGVFEWNLWTQHEYWAYMQMLDCIYEYGGQVICPNEWGNNSQNTGLWIPGYNSQLLAALQDFVTLAQIYPRGTCPSLRVDKLTVWFYSDFSTSLQYFTKMDGLIIIASGWFICVIFMIIALVMISTNTRHNKIKNNKT